MPPSLQRTLNRISIFFEPIKNNWQSLGEREKCAARPRKRNKKDPSILSPSFLFPINFDRFRANSIASIINDDCCVRLKRPSKCIRTNVISIARHLRCATILHNYSLNELTSSIFRNQDPIERKISYH